MYAKAIDYISRVTACQGRFLSANDMLAGYNSVMGRDRLSKIDFSYAYLEYIKSATEVLNVKG